MAELTVAAPAFVEVSPPAVLRPFVERLWAHRIEAPPPSEGRRLLPDGRIELVWISGFGVHISGPQTRYGQPPDLTEMLALGASFRPGAAPYLLRTPASALVDRHVALDAVDPRLAARLDDRLGDARDVREAIAVFGHELARRLGDVTPPPADVREAIRLLDGITVKVSDAAAHVFLSERELQRRFAEDVGYGPKTLQRVLRFQSFLRTLAAPRIELAAAAALAGYADQSHLSRETRRLAGLSPRRLTSWTH